MESEALQRMAKNLAGEEPTSKGLRLAAVSVIITERETPQVLLIERAARAGDPWSGQIAFPGGKTQTEDKTARDTAVRETFEEVGFDLAVSSRFLGYGEVIATHTGTMEVVPVAFELKQPVAVRTNGEVASFRWVGLHELMAPRARSKYVFNSGGQSVALPAYTVGDYVVWGLTYRILTSLFGAV
ncbi:MAG: CoA pyrophosphatase [Nitrososphaerota archaeon]|nr:CoA pyrophosphatase [Nitrososphaerota archaeon]